MKRSVLETSTAPHFEQGKSWASSTRAGDSDGGWRCVLLDSQEGLNYTLVNIQKTMEHHQILWVINCKRSFSIAMLVYQRVHDKWLNITFRPSIYWIVELVDGFKYVLHPTNGMAVLIDNLFLPGVAQPPTRYHKWWMTTVDIFIITSTVKLNVHLNDEL